MTDNFLREGFADRAMFFCFCGTLFFVPVATSPAVIMSVFALVFWVFSGKVILERHKWLGQKWLVPVALFVCLNFIGLLYTNNIVTGLYFVEKTHYWLLACAAATLYMNAGRADKLMKYYVAGVTFTSTLFVLQNLGIAPMRPPYSVGLHNKWAHISFSLLDTFGILVLSYYFYIAESRKGKYITGGLILINFIALAILSSDSGHLAFILLSPILAYNIVGRKNLKVVALVSFLFVAALFLSPVTQSRFQQIFDQTDTYIEGEVYTQVGMRYYMWSGAAKLYMENPVIGLGTGGYQDAMEKFRPSAKVPNPIQPHNSFLYMAVSFGIPGIIVILWLFYAILKKGWDKRFTLLGFCTIAYALVLIIGSLTDTQILQVHTGTLFAIFMGLPLGFEQEAR